MSLAHTAQTLAAPRPPLALRGLTQAHGERLLFAELELLLQPGELLWVQGANGSGKTSLLRLICGLAQPWAGRVEGVEHAKGGLLYIGHLPGLKGSLSALENLQAAAALEGRPCDGAQARTALAAWGLAEQVDLRVDQLSQGQARRVALARLLLPEPPRLWVLDEPFAALDEASVRQLAQRLEAHAELGGTVVFTSHLAPPLQRAPRTLRFGALSN